MTNVSILNDTLKDFNYYAKKIPMFLRQSNSFMTHFKIWYDLLVSSNTTSVVGVSDTLFSLLNIFDDDYLKNAYARFNLTPESNVNLDILDKLGTLFGLQRQFELKYKNHQQEDVVRNINLSDKDFLKFIKIQIAKNYCDGSAKQIQDMYNQLNLPIRTITSEFSATAYTYLIATDDNNNDISDDIRNLFLAGELIIKNIGIKYQYEIIDINNILIWSNAEEEIDDVKGWGDFTSDGIGETGGYLVI